MSTKTLFGKAERKLQEIISKIGLVSLEPSKQDSEPKEEENEENEVALKVIKMAEVSRHSEADACWMVIHDNVYDITLFLRQHPGGEDILLEHGGRDATIPYTEVAHSIDAHAALQPFLIGALHEDDRINKTKKPKTY